MSEDQRDPVDLGHDEARALRLLTEEVRGATPPDLAWDAIEQRLMQRIAQEPAQRRRAARGSAGSVIAFAVAAAAVVMLIASSSQRRLDSAAPSPAPHQVERSALPRAEAGGAVAYQVTGVPPRSVIESGREPLRFVEPGVATWTLAPDARAVLVSAGLPHVISLERGSIHAEVVPRSDTHQLLEAFVVEAGGTRVAVHGTVFSVERFADTVAVEVARGSVTIGPAGHRGATTAHLLVSPARASFALDSGRLIEMLPLRGHAVAAATTLDPLAQGDAQPSTPALLPAPGQSSDGEHEPSPQPHATRPTHEPQPAAPTAVEEPEEPAPAPVRLLSLNEARALVVSCLTASARHDDSSETVVTISSTVTVVLGEDGTVNSVRFAPPLKPELQSRCGGTLFSHKLQGAGSVTFRVTFSAR